MGRILVLSVGFGMVTAASITILGNRQLLSGKNLTLDSAITILSDWRLWLSMFFALLSRVLFVATNIVLIGNSRWSTNATTLTTFITASAYIFVVMSNYIFLDEALNSQQIIGAVIVILGVAIMLNSAGS